MPDFRIVVRRLNRVTRLSVTAPAMSRTEENVAASIAFLSRANRHRMEFPANAPRAIQVDSAVRNSPSEWIVGFI